MSNNIIRIPKIIFDECNQSESVILAFIRANYNENTKKTKKKNLDCSYSILDRKYIGKVTGISDRHITRILKKFEERGWIRVEKLNKMYKIWLDPKFRQIPSRDYYFFPTKLIFAKDLSWREKWIIMKLYANSVGRGRIVYKTLENIKRSRMVNPTKLQKLVNDGYLWTDWRGYIYINHNKIINLQGNETFMQHIGGRSRFERLVGNAVEQKNKKLGINRKKYITDWNYYCNNSEPCGSISGSIGSIGGVNLSNLSGIFCYPYRNKFYAIGQNLLSQGHFFRPIDPRTLNFIQLFQTLAGKSQKREYSINSNCKTNPSKEESIKQVRLRINDKITSATPMPSSPKVMLIDSLGNKPLFPSTETRTETENRREDREGREGREGGDAGGNRCRNSIGKEERKEPKLHTGLYTKLDTGLYTISPAGRDVGNQVKACEAKDKRGEVIKDTGEESGVFGGKVVKYTIYANEDNYNQVGDVVEIDFRYCRYWDLSEEDKDRVYIERGNYWDLKTFKEHRDIRIVDIRYFPNAPDYEFFAELGYSMQEVDNLYKKENQRRHNVNRERGVLISNLGEGIKRVEYNYEYPKKRAYKAYNSKNYSPPGWIDIENLDKYRDVVVQFDPRDPVVLSMSKYYKSKLTPIPNTDILYYLVFVYNYVFLSYKKAVEHILDRFEAIKRAEEEKKIEEEKKKEREGKIDFEELVFDSKDKFEALYSRVMADMKMIPLIDTEGRMVVGEKINSNIKSIFSGVESRYKEEYEKKKKKQLSKKYDKFDEFTVDELNYNMLTNRFVSIYKYLLKVKYRFDDIEANKMVTGKDFMIIKNKIKGFKRMRDYVEFEKLMVASVVKWGTIEFMDVLGSNKNQQFVTLKLFMFNFPMLYYYFKRRLVVL